LAGFEPDSVLYICEIVGGDGSIADLISPNLSTASTNQVVQEHNLSHGVNKSSCARESS
ncbi:hypothetical protein MKW98_000342, partial [Papaver atlanticum]